MAVSNDGFHLIRKQIISFFAKITPNRIKQHLEENFAEEFGKQPLDATESLTRMKSGNMMFACDPGLNTPSALLVGSPVRHTAATR